MKVCPHCREENPDQVFCGSCGSHLELKEYIATSVREQIESRDRGLVETDVTFRVFERVLGVGKNVAWIVGILVAIVGVLGIWKFSDFWSSVNAAKQAVTDTSKLAKDQIAQSSGAALGEVRTIVGTATTTIKDTAKQASRESETLKTTSAQTQKDTTSFRKELANSREQLQEANKLQPQMADMQQQLSTALDQLRKQQSIISNSESFVKNVFSSHKTDIFTVGHEPPTRLVTVPPPTGGDRSVVLLLLTGTPIKETLQLQYRVFTQPPNSFVTLHNLVIFSWGESLSNLQNQQLSASYFPDASDKELMTSLSERDGRIFADGEPLPHFNKPDPDFPGDRWIELKDGQLRLK
jgi:hypothetical protein